MLNETEYFFAAEKKKIAGLLSDYVYTKLLAEANANNSSVESYSSTLSFVCYNKINGKIMTFIIGDSLVYTISQGNLSLACTPKVFDNSKTYTTTTKGVADVTEINVIPNAENVRYLLATDGAWKTFYSCGALSDEAELAVKDENIISFLENQQCMDDCSIVMMDIPKGA